MVVTASVQILMCGLGSQGTEARKEAGPQTSKSQLKADEQKKFNYVVIIL